MWALHRCPRQAEQLRLPGVEAVGMNGDGGTRVHSRGRSPSRPCGSRCLVVQQLVRGRRCGSAGLRGAAPTLSQVEKVTSDPLLWLGMNSHGPALLNPNTEI